MRENTDQNNSEHGHFLRSECRAPSHDKNYFLLHLTNLLDKYSTHCKKVIVIGDFNLEAEIEVMKGFLQECMLYNMMKQNTCLKGNKCSYIDLLITNSKFSFMKTRSFETSLSDYNHMIYTILKTKFEKPEPKKLIYCNIKNFNVEQFKSDICNSMYENQNTTRKSKASF